jgi:phytanoyl-CoA hydroxylase
MYLEDSKSLGEELERDFTIKAAERGLTAEEARSAFNQNVSRSDIRLRKDSFSRWFRLGWYIKTLPNSLSRWAEAENGWSATTKLETRYSTIAVCETRKKVLLMKDMIHAGGVNRDPGNRIRLSGDLRFADKDAPHEERWSKWVILDGRYSWWEALGSLMMASEPLIRAWSIGEKVCDKIVSSSK